LQHDPWREFWRRALSTAIPCLTAAVAAHVVRARRRGRKR